MNKRNKSTFRFPFDIDSRFFLGLAVLFFILSISKVNNFLFPERSIKELKTLIEDDLAAKKNQIATSVALEKLIHLACINQLNEQGINELNAFNFGIQIYANDSLVYWNSKQFAILNDTFSFNKPTPYVDNYGIYMVYKKQYLSSKHYALFSIPIKYINSLNNKQFNNSFAVDEKGSCNANVIVMPASEHDETIYVDGKPFCYLVKSNDIDLNIESNAKDLFFHSLSFIFFGISIHTYFKVTTNRRIALKRYLVLLAIVISIRSLNYWIAFPDDFSNYLLFHPEVYASDMINKSLGDVFVNMCLSFWLLLFFIINVQGNFGDYSFLKSKPIFGILIFILSIFLQIYFFQVILSIIQDSVIDFDFTNFSELSLLSVIGLISICVIIGCMILLTFISCNYLKITITAKWIKYVLLAFAVGICYVVNKNYDTYFHLFFFVSIFIFYLIYDSILPKIKFDFNSYVLLLGIIIIAFFYSLVLNHYIQIKENESRYDFARKILNHNTVEVEDKLSSIKTSLLTDKQFAKNCLVNKKLDKLTLSKKLFQTYMASSLSTYRCEINIYNANGDDVPAVQLADTDIRNLKLDTLPDTFIDVKFEDRNSEKIRFSENTLGNLQFAIIASSKIIAYVNIAVTDYFHLNNKIRSSFIDGNPFSINAQHEYSYAYYENNQLARVNGDFVFPYNAIKPNKMLDNSESYMTKIENRNVLWLKSDYNGNMVAVAQEVNYLYLITTLFAYIFFIFFSVISLYILGNVIARSNLNYARFINLLSLNLRLRLHFAILSVVIVSFLGIGYFTYYFLVDRIEKRISNELKVSSQNIQDDLNIQIKTLNYSKPDLVIDTSTMFSSLIKLFKGVKSQFNKEISIYDIQSGDLIFTTQNELYQSGLLKTKISYPLLAKSKSNQADYMFHEESIGKYFYSAVYSNLHNTEGKIIGIMQIPSLSGKFEAQIEKNTIIITLINIYVFVFLISAMFALAISNSVTRPFRFVVKQFAKISLLQTNKPLKWNSNDEIGLLVKEYNRTLRKLENSSVLLAKSERELAWREMAKQVAHEIKNPLTPMKLSVQLLQRALINNNTNIKEISERVTKTLIEQIDVLAEIATNFSSFAKMPVDHIEPVSLNEVLYSVTGMYNDTFDSEFSFFIPKLDTNVLVDKAKLIRVFTNIIQNAIQAIPANRKGNIALKVSKLDLKFIRVSIIDNGEGISAERGKKLFEPYFTTKTSGTGLGLAMCKDIIQNFGGRITFESTLGEGTSFHIDILMEPIKKGIVL
jgi:two-component system, NtrC family, nitrogen regulation sensor histidine kinase NtrY